MKKFLAKFIGSPSSVQKKKWDAESPAKQAELTQDGIQAWGKWVEANKNSIVDFGAPLGKTKRIAPEGISDIRNADTAYVVVQAESHEAAAKLFIDHPHFTIFPGDSVEVMECLDLPLSDTVQIEASIQSPLPKVWEYWTEPKHITKWNFAIPDWHCPSATNDLRPGGKYSARMEAKDGSFGFDFEAIYDEVIPQKKLTYTMTDGRKATTLFEQQGDTTHVTTKFTAEKQNPVEMQKTGWQAILNNFKKYTEAT